ncbi:MAG: hypothetical protein KA158_08900 [Leucobacter sp.]|nr:hypothetical protein [Leucobacter sp.]
MSTAARLTLYGAGLVAAFGAAFGLASVVVPESFVADWIASGEQAEHEPATAEQAPESAAH